MILASNMYSTNQHNASTIKMINTKCLIYLLFLNKQPLFTVKNPLWNLWDLSFQRMASDQQKRR